MSTRRQQRVGELLKHEISRIVTFDLRDPRIGFVTVTGVKPSADLGQARVYVSILGDQDTQANTIAALQNARGRIQSEVGRRCKLPRLPRLSFYRDEGVKKSFRISKILSEVLPSETEEDEDRRQENEP